MTSFFYVVSIAFHTIVPAFRKCMDTSRKKSFGWQCSRSCTACCTSSLDLKDLPPIASLSGPKTWKSLWRGQANTADVEDTRRTELGLLQQLNGQYGAEHCHVATKHLYSEVHVVWTWWQDTGDSWGDLHMLHWSQHSPWACSAPKLPLVHPKRESAWPFQRMVVCRIFSVLVRRYGAIPCSLSWFPAGGSGPRFHLQ